MKRFDKLKPYFSKKGIVVPYNTDYVSMIAVFWGFFFMNLFLSIYKYVVPAILFIVLHGLIAILGTIILIKVRNNLIRCVNSYVWSCTLLIASICTFLANVCVILNMRLFVPLIVTGIFSYLTGGVITYYVATKHMRKEAEVTNHTSYVYPIGFSVSGAIVAIVWGVLRTTAPTEETMSLLFFISNSIVLCPVLGYASVRSLSLGSPFGD